MTPDVRYLILWPTGACDLDCTYCYRGLRGGRMSADTIRRSIDFANRSPRPYHLQIAGGEPLLVPDLVREIVDYARQSQHPPTIGLQTNATAVTSELAHFLRENQVQVGVSIDGPPTIQEQLRGKAAATLRGMQQLDEAGVWLRTTTVVTSQNVGHLGSLALLLSQFAQLRGMALDPLVSLGSAFGRNDLVCDEASAVEGIGGLYDALAFVNSRRRHPLQWRELDKVRRALASPGCAASDCQAFCHAQTSQSMAITPDGSVYPCSQSVGDLTKYVGNIHEPQALNESTLRSAYQGLTLTGPCHTCDLQGRCPGDCPSRLSAHQQGEHLTCVIYRTILAKETS